MTDAAEWNAYARDAESEIGSLKRELAAAKADVERLRALVENAEAILINCDVSTGVCCCGDAMDGHASPMSCGHSPVDMGEYTISGWIDEARAALAKEKAS